MTVNDNISNLANLEFLVNFSDGKSKDEIESELFRVFFQRKDTIPYDRSGGGNFVNIEQEKNSQLAAINIARDMVYSVYKLNQSRNFDPLIVVGFSDIEIKDNFEGADSDYVLLTKYRVIQDLQNQYAVGIEL